MPFIAPLRSLAMPALSLCALLLVTTACSDDTVDYDGPYGHGSQQPGETPEIELPLDKWVTFKPEGAECADGTQYKYFIKKRSESDNVLVLYEGGGACWSYETCSAAEGTLGALGVNCVLSNKDLPDDQKVDCVADDYADTYYALPDTISDDMLEGLLEIIPSWIHVKNRRISVDTVLPVASGGFDKKDKLDVSPMHDWNLVFVPYCTADLYSGKKEAVYKSADGSDSLEFKHVGLKNVEIVAKELNDIFPSVPKFAMNGCSAGGAGVMSTYPFYRSEMKGIEKGYVFSDAGPFFPTTRTDVNLPNPAHSRALHDAVVAAWDVPKIFNELIEFHPELGVTDVPHDVSEIYNMISRAYPQDRFNISFTQTDYNYSLYSYTGFHEPPLNTRANNSHDAKIVYQYWQDDLKNLLTVLEPLDNFGWYMPYWRRTNDAHCISVIGYEDVDKEGGDAVQGLLSLLGNPNSGYYAGTEIEENGTTYTYRDEFENTLNNDNAQYRKLATDAPGYMGLRKFCTPPYLLDEEGNEIPDSNAKCQCAFGEYDDVDPENGRDICTCMRIGEGLGLGVDACADMLDDPHALCENQLYELVDPNSTTHGDDLCQCMNLDETFTLESCEDTLQDREQLCGFELYTLIDSNGEIGQSMCACFDDLEDYGDDSATACKCAAKASDEDKKAACFN